MFGTLKPATCRLPAAAKKNWRQAYCGTCKALGDGYGLLSRATLTFDAALYALAAEALATEPGPTGARCRCPLMPVTFRPIVHPDRPSVRAAAAVQLLLADQWFEDQRLDGRRILGSLKRLTVLKSEAAKLELQQLGVSTDQFEDLAARQTALEVNGKTSPLAAAEPTASLLEQLFAALPRVAGVPSLYTPHLGELGRAIGTVIYLLDAVEDLPRDAQRRGAFNPCLNADGAASAYKFEAVAEALGTALDRIQTALGCIPWKRHLALLESTLVTALRSRCRRALQVTAAWVESSAGPKKPLWARVLAFALAPLMWLVRPFAFAIPKGSDPEGSGGKSGSGQQGKRRRKRRSGKAKKQSSGCSCCSDDCGCDCCTAWICCDFADCACDCGDCCDCTSCCDC